MTRGAAPTESVTGMRPVGGSTKAASPRMRNALTLVLPPRDCVVCHRVRLVLGGEGSHLTT